MAVTPRNRAAQSPVGDRPRRCSESFSNWPVSTQCVDQFFNHAPLSQIVTARASIKNHSLCVAGFWRSAQIAGRRLAPALETTPGMLLDHDPATLDNDILEIWAHAGEREKRQISEIAKALLRDGTGG